MENTNTQSKSRREREREQRRNDILDAASRVFVTQGFSAATMDDVATEAELSKGALYLYFESKEALFLSLSNRSLDHVVAAFEAIAETKASATGASRFRDMLTAYAENAQRNSEKFRVMVGRLASKAKMDLNDPSFKAHRDRVDRIIGLMVASLEDGQADGSVRTEIDPLLAAFEAWGGLLGVVLVTINFDELRRRTGRELDDSRVIPEFIETLIRGLRASS